jgi:hypothetical protein
MMVALSPSELLVAWEQGLGQLPVERALTLLAATDSKSPQNALAKLSIGRRDDRLLSLREQIFGSELNSLTVCPGCGERLEFRVTAADLRASSCPPVPERLSLKVDDWQVEFRLPNSDDLMDIGGLVDATAGRASLLKKCILSAERSQSAEAVNALPEKVVIAVIERMSESDPQANVQLALSCPMCAREWRTTFDIVSFLWSEINAWADRILREVHTLARAYGWREADILALSPWRRQAYLEMVSR